VCVAVLLSIAQRRSNETDAREHSPRGIGGAERPAVAIDRVRVLRFGSELLGECELDINNVPRHRSGHDAKFGNARDVIDIDSIRLRIRRSRRRSAPFASTRVAAIPNAVILDRAVMLIRLRGPAHPARTDRGDADDRNREHHQKCVEKRAG
jgi:hypothetical protein